MSDNERTKLEFRSETALRRGQGIFLDLRLKK
jgi:hypothetical protein